MAMGGPVVNWVGLYGTGWAWCGLCGPDVDWVGLYSTVWACCGLGGPVWHWMGLLCTTTDDALAGHQYLIRTRRT